MLRTTIACLAVVGVLSAAGCSDDQETSTPTSAPGSTATAGASSPVEDVSNAIRSGEVDALVAAAVMTPRPCVAEPTLSNFGPQCPEGVDEGTDVPSFLLAQCEGSLITEEAEVRSSIERALTDDDSVFAVVNGGLADDQGVRGPGAGIVVEPATPTDDNGATIWTLDEDGGLVAINYGCSAQTGQEIIAEAFGDDPDYLTPPA